MGSAAFSGQSLRISQAGVERVTHGSPASGIKTLSSNSLLIHHSLSRLVALSRGGIFHGTPEDILKLQIHRAQAKEITSSWSRIQVSALLVIPGYKSVREQLLNHLHDIELRRI